ncbi:hypothetical protein CLV98_103224 [Dyadobacter jejuensis]|uniref:Uncharacterized protein n=1 Tax=Dyadobacter jejuensis TaxID=1082580 RepID=A0A316B8F0_9BACT|nr:hypothetical protein CLV98_103224 [Dyadobacter jejuensis]
MNSYRLPVHRNEGRGAVGAKIPWGLGDSFNIDLTPMVSFYYLLS